MESRPKILVTGGMGFIGAHIVVELVNSGYEPLIYDNMSNCKPIIRKTLCELCDFPLRLFVGDIQNKYSLQNVFRSEKIQAVIHLAGLKSVNDSIENPIVYYQNNICGTATLLEVMGEYGCKNLVFSSSATVYGDQPSPLKESAVTGVGLTNPYGRTKYMIEEMLKDLHRSDPSWSITVLRYFNPVGAHPSGEIGEDPKSVPGNLFPYLLKVALGEYPELTIFGDNYDTSDGTCIRDFIHVTDLAMGHLFALKNVSENPNIFNTYNLGTGSGTTVMKMVQTFEQVTGIKINYKIGPRRPGDVAVTYADVSKAKEELSWSPKFTLEDICRDGWRYVQKNNSNH